MRHEVRTQLPELDREFRHGLTQFDLVNHGIPPFRAAPNKDPTVRVG